MLTIEGLLARTAILYDLLGESGLTRASIEELAKYRQAGIPFAKLSVDLKKSLLTIIRGYEDKTAEMDMREAMSIDRVSAYPASMVSSPEQPAEQPTEQLAEQPAEQPANNEDSIPEQSA